MQDLKPLTLAFSPPGANYGTEAVQDAFKAAPVRRRWNTWAIILSFLFPYAIFVAVCAATGYPVTYNSILMDARTFCYLIDGIALAMVLYTGILATFAIERHRRTGRTDLTWYSFLFLTGLLAWVLGVLIGNYNASAHLAEYYEYESLATYNQVNVTAKGGAQLMDAGRIHFLPGTRLNLSMSMGFRQGKMYCVAPVVPQDNSTRLAFYDFWAVGTDCCTPHKADYECGSYNDARTHSGLRLLDKKLESMFTLAARQAEATYGIRTKDLVFLNWMQDPDTAVTHHMEDALSLFLKSIYWYIFVQLLLVTFFVTLLWMKGFRSGDSR